MSTTALVFHAFRRSCRDDRASENDIDLLFGMLKLPVSTSTS